MNPVLSVFAIALLACSVCAIAGVYLVLRRMAMISDAISHAILPGLVAAYWLAKGPNIWIGLVGAVAAGLVTVIGVELLTQSRKVKEDAAIGLVFPTMFAIGVAWISVNYANVHLDTDAVLFGEITLAPFDRLVYDGNDLGPQAAWILGVAGVVTLFFLALLRKELRLATFDPALALISGFAPATIHYGLMVVVSTTTVAAFTAVGAILAVSLIIVPAAAARLWTEKLGLLFAFSVTISILGGAVGTGLAIVFDTSISGMIAVMLGIIFLASVLFAPNRGVIAARAKRMKHRLELSIQALLIHLSQHQGSSEELIESSKDHLEQELGWSKKWVNRIVASSTRRGLVTTASNRCQLTSKGAELARQAALATQGVKADSNPVV
ncbi:metal ABC transporter permease [Kamptonema cortianum]|nr:metal ABC transporter permease [Geitlerinema splendidum]MDK3155290.1 metal ABC transporter permease [Kamptonema cortianum]